MSSNWAGLNYKGEDNLGGNRIARIAPPEWFTALPLPNTYNLVELAATFDTYNWQLFRFTQDTANFSEKEQLGVGGPVWQHSFKAFVPGDSLDSRNQAEVMARLKWVVEATDNNGLIRRLGDLRNPARLEVDFTTDASTTGGRGYTFTWSWTNDRPAPIVQVDPDNDGSYTVIPPEEVNPGSGASG